MPTANDRYQAEPDDHVCTEPLEDEEGRIYRICQEAVGADRVVGGGEYPDPTTPPRSPAPGSARPDDSDEADEADRPDEAHEAPGPSDADEADDVEPDDADEADGDEAEPNVAEAHEVDQADRGTDEREPTWRS
jgi:hypothetical protein